MRHGAMGRPHHAAETGSAVIRATERLVNTHTVVSAVTFIVSATSRSSVAFGRLRR